MLEALALSLSAARDKRLFLKSLSGNEDEEHAEGGVDKEGDGEEHESSFGEKAADVGLADAREVEGGIFAKTQEGENGVQRVLV